eukprot:7391847-Prymnesium_polylepis.9
MAHAHHSLQMPALHMMYRHARSLPRCSLANDLCARRCRCEEGLTESSILDFGRQRLSRLPGLFKPTYETIIESLGRQTEPHIGFIGKVVIRDICHDRRVFCGPFNGNGITAAPVQSVLDPSPFASTCCNPARFGPPSPCALRRRLHFPPNSYP